MDEFAKQITSLCELSEKLTQAEKNRQRLDIVGKISDLKFRLNKVERILKSPNRTNYHIKKHLLLVMELKQLCDTQNINSPLSIIKKEMELANKLQSVFSKLCQTLIEELNSENLKQ